jgi:hypothetical protein
VIVIFCIENGIDFMDLAGNVSIRPGQGDPGRKHLKEIEQACPTRKCAAALLIAIFALVFEPQALDGITIQVMLVFAFCNDEVFEAGSLVVEFPGVAEIARPARARGLCNISDIRIVDRLAIRAGEDGNVAHLVVAVESNDGVLKALVMGEGPNLLAFILGLELANLTQARVRLSIRHAQAEPENLRSGLPGGGERSDAKD